MRTALDAGADPNERDYEPDHRRNGGRPLAFCLDDSRGQIGGESIKNNLQVINLLLEYSADPRLDPVPEMKGMIGCPQPPVETARLLAEGMTTEELIRQFYREAYKVLKEATDRLDSKWFVIRL